MTFCSPFAGDHLIEVPKKDQEYTNISCEADESIGKVIVIDCGCKGCTHLSSLEVQ